MTDIDGLLDRLKLAGVRLALDGERLSVNAPKGALTETLRSELVARKEELKSRLVQSGGSSGDRSQSPPAIVPAARLPAMPVSHAQRRMWLLKQLDPAGTAYHVPSAFRIVGALDETALEQSLTDLVARHESLRMRFMIVDDELCCTVDPAGRTVLERHDLSHLAAEQRDAQAQQLVCECVRRPFDIARGPLLHVAVIRLEPQHHVLCLVFDHIIADGPSVAIFLGELRQLYDARSRGEQARLPATAIGYPDYVAWQRRWLVPGGALARHLDFWKTQLAELPAALRLPTDHPRPRLASSRGAILALRLDPALAARLKAFARQQGATLYMVLLAAYQVLLHRYAGASDFAVGTAVANRSQPEVQHIFGLFANNIAIRADLSGNPTVHELIARVSVASGKAYAHQDMPFDLLVEELAPRRDADHPPIFQTMFTLHTQLVMNFSLGAAQCSPLEFQAGTSRFDLSADVFELADGMRICFEYNTDLFQPDTIARMVDNYQVLLEAFVGSPDVPIQQLPLLSAGERQMVLESFNATALPEEDGPFVARFDRVAGRTPDATAVSFQGASLSYRELRRRADRLAQRLTAQGLGGDAIVGVCLERSLQMVVALIGIQKAGAAYLPIDPGFPADRIRYMLDDSGCSAVVTSRGALRRLELPAAVAVVDIDDELPSAADPGDPPVASAPPGHDQLAYLIYTSGSTGRPKGVAVTHGNLANFLASMRREPGLSADDVLAAVTTISFDIAGLEIYLPLSVGARIELVPAQQAADGAALAEVLARCGATLMQATPATWRMLVEVDWRGGTGFKALCGGEPLPAALAGALRERVDELWNLYGPTETTIWSTGEQVMPDAGTITIGRPIANTRVYVLDGFLAPVPVGVAGEIWIGGAGVAAGYHRKPELTAERFRTDPFAAGPGARMYRTGDLGRWRGDGRLEHLGRTDHQVKVRGFRIELGEIEAALAAISGVRQALVVARELAAGDARLVAYVVFAPGYDLTPSEIRKALRQILPNYMIPAAVVALAGIPLTPNGKVDRAALPDPFELPVQVPAGNDPPAPGMEQLLAGLWRDVLKVDRIVASDNFFDLGGHSLLSVRVAAAVQRATGWRMDPRTLFFQSLREVAAGAPAEASAASRTGAAVGADAAIEAAR